jgi:excisionase family DNA binding protein
MKNSDIIPAGLRVQGAAAYLGVSVPLVKKLVREGKVRSVTVGRCRVFPIAALDELLTVRHAA